MNLKRKKLITPLVAIATLVFAALACEINVGGPETPEAPIPVSTEAVLSLVDMWTAAFEGAVESGQVNLVVNESQLTSLLALRLESEAEPLLQDPQVYLQDGKMQIFGKATRGSLAANVRIILAVEITEAGVPDLVLESADFGPWPVPEGLLIGLSAMLDEAFTGTIGPAAIGVRLESVVIDNGLMALSGRIR
jgi:hypothetical protein